MWPFRRRKKDEINLCCVWLAMVEAALTGGAPADSAIDRADAVVAEFKDRQKARADADAEAQAKMRPDRGPP